MTGGDEPDQLIASYKNFCAHHRKNTRGRVHNEGQSTKLFDLYDSFEQFSLDDIDLAKKWTVQQEKIEKENDAFIKHI